MISTDNTSSDCVALIVAAGRGHRFRSKIPKQYLKLNGKCLLTQSIEMFFYHPSIKSVRVIIHPEDRLLYDEATKDLDLLDPVLGGHERQDSVRLGLESFRDINPKYILIHDAVRPFVNENIINNILSSLKNKDLAVIPGISVKDTLKRVHENIITGTVDRTNLWQVQTPQGFNFKAIIAAHESSNGLSLTDDAAIAELAGIKVRVIDGCQSNFKITTTQDLFRAEQLLKIDGDNNIMRVGIGTDVHSFKDGSAIILCGIKIPFNKSLKGHSDADVAMHAVTDALLGSVGAGDIGDFFPPSDPQWKDCASEIFLIHAGNQILQRQGLITNIDLTIICENPKISGYKSQMQKNIARILNINIDKVNIKATTTEKLGFIGRGEGIAAQAIASVKV